MKKRNFLFVILSLFVVFLMVSCSHTHTLTHVEAKAASTSEAGNKEYWTCSGCNKKFKDAEGKEEYKDEEVIIPKLSYTMEQLLEEIKFEDKVITYDGEKHTITYDGVRPEGVKIVCTPTTSYYKVGNYKFTLKITYDGKTESKTAYLKIVKIQPKYKGETAYTVYLNDPETQPSFEFDTEGVEVIDQPFYKEAGTYEYTLKTKETDSMASVEETKITYTVLPSKLGFEFKSKTLVSDGVTPVELTLSVPEGSNAVLANYDVVYENNSSAVQGTYNATAKVYQKGTQTLLDEYRAILTVDYANNDAFDQYANSVFIDYIEGDQISINLLTVDYESLGLEHGDSTWYTFKGFDQYTTEAYQSDLETVAEERRTVNSWKEEKLSLAQKVTLRRIDEYVTMYENLLADYDYEFISVNYVDQYGGYVADFPTYVESYSLRNTEDIEDYIKMIESVGEAFPSYYDYIVAKKEKGKGFSEFTLTEFNSQLGVMINDFESDEGYYLSRVTIDKLDAAKEELGLTDAEYNTYKAQLEHGINETMYNALKDLSANVTEFIATNDYFDKADYNPAYYGSTTKGQNLYFAQLQNRLGIFNLNPKTYLAEIEEYLAYYKNKFKAAQSVLTDYASAIQDGDETVYDYGDDILNVFDYLFEFADEIVYPLSSTPEIDVTWMDPSTTVNTNTLAYYMKSALDSFSNEYIHLNGRSLGECNYDTVTTIAHEGYPGHLYAYVNTKENPNLTNLTRIATYTGHGEGWAKYVEYRIHEFMYEKSIGTAHEKDYKALMEYAQAWEPYVFMIYTRADFGINYQGWKVSDAAKFMKENGLNDAAAQEFFDTLNESASQYPPYGYGQVVFIEFHEKAKALLGAAYDERELNKVILNQGWCSLDSLKGYVKEYLDQQSFLLGL